MLRTVEKNRNITKNGIATEAIPKYISDECSFFVYKERKGNKDGDFLLMAIHRQAYVSKC